MPFMPFVCWGLQNRKIWSTPCPGSTGLVLSWKWPLGWKHSSTGKQFMEWKGSKRRESSQWVEVCEKFELIPGSAAPQSAMLDMFQNRSKTLDVLILRKNEVQQKKCLEYSCFALTMKEYSLHLTAAWPYLPYLLLKLPRWTTDRLRTILPKIPCLGIWNTLLKAFKILIKRPGRSGDTIEINGKTTNSQDFFCIGS